MKRTSAGILVTAALLGAVVGFGVDQLLTSAGRATFTPSLLLPVLLVMLGAAAVLLALPIRRATRGVNAAPVDPFRAVRVAMLAKASSIVGAAVAGVSGGLLVFLLSRPVTPVGSMGPVVASLVGGLVLLAAAFVAEQLCTIRKDDDDEHPGRSGSGDPADSGDGGDPGYGLSHRD